MKRTRKISAIVRAKRAELGISQDGLANMLGLKNAQYISNIERDLCGLAPKYLLQVSRALNTSVEDLTKAYKEDFSEHIDLIANKQVHEFCRKLV